MVNKAKSERITIDYDVVFYNSENGHSESTGQLVIIEQKRDGRYPSPLKELLLNLRIKPHGFSKYCIGSLLTNPTLKSNLFKSRLREIHKLVNY